MLEDFLPAYKIHCSLKWESLLPNHMILVKFKIQVYNTTIKQKPKRPLKSHIHCSVRKNTDPVAENTHDVYLPRELFDHGICALEIRTWSCFPYWKLTIFTAKNKEQWLMLILNALFLGKNEILSSSLSWLCLDSNPKLTSLHSVLVNCWWNNYLTCANRQFSWQLCGTYKTGHIKRKSVVTQTVTCNQWEADHFWGFSPGAFLRTGSPKCWWPSRGADKERLGRPGRAVWSTLITVNLQCPYSITALPVKGNKSLPLEVTGSQNCYFCSQQWKNREKSTYLKWGE